MYFKPLIDYALAQNLCVQEDACFLENQLLDLYHADSAEELPAIPLSDHPKLGELLEAYTDLAAQRGILQGDGITARDLFAARLMGYFTPLPSAVALEFSIRGMQGQTGSITSASQTATSRRSASRRMSAGRRRPSSARSI